MGAKHPMTESASMASQCICIVMREHAAFARRHAKPVAAEIWESLVTHLEAQNTETKAAEED